MADVIFECSFLGGIVYLTEERTNHIRTAHPEFSAMEPSAVLAILKSAVEEPSIVVQSRKDPQGLIFGRWEPHLYGGKYATVTIITSPERN